LITTTSILAELVNPTPCMALANIPVIASAATLYDLAKVKMSEKACANKFFNSIANSTVNNGIITYLLTFTETPKCLGFGVLSRGLSCQVSWYASSTCIKHVVRGAIWLNLMHIMYLDAVIRFRYSLLQNIQAVSWS
jgi:hypothetical protein